MYKEELRMLIEFMGEDLLKKENQIKLEDLVFSKVKDKADFCEINEFLMSLENYKLKEFLYIKLLQSFFRRFNLVYEKNTLKYGDNSEKINIDMNVFNEMIDLLEESEINGEVLFYVLSKDLQKRLKAVKQLLKDGSKKLWNDEELKSFLGSLKPLTQKFLKLLVEKGKVKSEEIIEALELSSRKSVSALVSAIVRNAPKDKEKLIFKEGEYIKLNENYRDIIYKFIVGEKNESRE